MADQKPAPSTASKPAATATKGEIAKLAPARLAYLPAVESEFGITRAAWRALCEAIFPAAKSSEAIVLALSYCKARKLDVFKRVIHIVPIWDSKAGKEIETVWPGIGELRVTASRTGKFAGSDPAAFGDDKTTTFEGKTKKGVAKKAKVTFPLWCQVTVYVLDANKERQAMPGPKVRWLETFSHVSHGCPVPNERWQRAPYQMIEKCAEAAALRRAFPEEMGGELIVDEVGRYGGEGLKDVTNSAEGGEPRRQDHKPGGAKAGLPVDGEDEETAGGEAEDTIEGGEGDATGDEAVTFTVCNADGEVMLPTKDPAEFVRNLVAEMETCAKEPERLAEVWKFNEPQLAHCPPEVAKTARARHEALSKPAAPGAGIKGKV